MSKKIFIFLILIFGIFIGGVVFPRYTKADTINITATDSRSDYYTAAQSCQDSYLYFWTMIDYSSGYYDYGGRLRFPLTGLSGTTVNSANLYLYQDYVYGTGVTSIYLYKEPDLICDVFPVSSLPPGYFLEVNTSGWANGYHTIDITDTVRTAVENGESDLYLFITGEDINGAQRYRRFRTEYNSAGMEPYLTVDYSFVALSCAAHNVSNWAWSANIGWISFSCTDTMAIGEGVDYGVDIDETIGDPSGYAWSEHIGWIRFDPPADFDTGFYPGDPQYPACLDTPATGQVCDGVGVGTLSGWARACAGTVNGDCNSSTRTDGWDGWIKLRCYGTECTTSDYGVWLDTSVSPQEFRGFAWGSDVVGWISFNRINCDPDKDGLTEGGANNPDFPDCPEGDSISDYQVITSLSINLPPTASDLSWSDKYCDVQPGVGQVSFQWLYEDSAGVAQSNYHLQIATDSGFSNLVLDCEIPQSISSGAYGSSAVKVVSSPVVDCTIPQLEIAYRGSGNLYYWRIKVKDGIKWSSDWVEGIPFDTPPHAYPWVDFNRCPLSPTVDEITQFCSIYEFEVCEAGACPLPTPAETTCYGVGGVKVPCSTWRWELDGDSIIDSGEPNPAYSYPTSGDYPARLEVFDGDGFSCLHTETIIVTLPIPEWREIPPF